MKKSRQIHSGPTRSKRWWYSQRWTGAAARGALTAGARGAPSVCAAVPSGEIPGGQRRLGRGPGRGIEIKARRWRGRAALSSASG